MKLLRVLAALCAAPVALPVLALLPAAAAGSGDLWPHLLRFVLPRALLESALLLAGVGVVVVTVGAGCAWLVSCYRFPGRRLLTGALMLPLALPTYVAAYAWLDVLHPAGPVQMALRRVLGVTDPRAIPLPEIRSLGGCVMVLGMVLFPYVYLAARAAFQTQGADALRAGRAAGAGGWRLFRRIGLPMARPAIAAGTALALLETLNDVGASEFLGVRTLTVSVYVTWITRSSLEGAAQIALLLLLLVGAVMLLERQGQRAGAHEAAHPARAELQTLRGPAGLAATLFCAVPVLLGFAIPVAYLAWAAWQRVARFGLPPELGQWIGNSALLAGLATILALGAALLLAFTARRDRTAAGPARAGAVLLRFGMLGYALPGGVAAVGLIIAFGGIDAALGLLGRWAPPLLSGSLAAVVLAYLIRFLAIPAGGLDAAYARLRREVDWSARAAGAGEARLLWRIHLPLLLPALSAAALLLFLDAMKELPATLLLRPLNTETLATALYAEAARGTYENGAVAALMLVLIGLPPILLLATARRFFPAEGRAGRGLRPVLPTDLPMDLPAGLSAGIVSGPPGLHAAAGSRRNR
ncbi:ABC transporter permease [Teichococcus vastitatis]|uniref:Iron ABC transporter permease n=1 Tax=Teichococcus vastitatis TaxID=2307076 RepID=A0ABS9W497_9PROT|nr:iron ABC transporter permease [Pseudoroseomonas vastitatis]MCI0753690.1 iron ABC transporter permease [Pseudoroseomonas vastitatis]